MSDLYLIVHKVRGEPAFDVAVRMECPICQGVGRVQEDILNEDSTGDAICAECDSISYWWIIPTSGHRAYPSTFMHLDCVTPQHVEMMKHSNIEGLPDHYPTRAAAPRPDLTALFRQAPTSHIRRR